MTKRKIIFITIVFISILTSLRLLWTNAHSAPEHPHAIQGVLDLRSWDFSTNQVITLDGEWAYYPNTFLIQNGVRKPSNAYDEGFIQMPKNLAKSENDEKFDYGTYRLRILLHDNEKHTFGMRIPSISTSYETFVNGNLLTQSGQPAITKEEYTPRSIPISTYFEAESNEIEIIIQVASFDSPIRKGIIRSIKFGNEDAIRSQQTLSINMQLLLTIVLLFHVIYSVILFIFGAREKSLIYFTLTILCSLLSVLIADDKLLLHWFPISYEWNLKLIRIAYLGISIFLLQFVKSLLIDYEKLRKLNLYNVFLWCYLLFTFITTLMPTNFYFLTLGIANLIYYIPFLIVPFILARSTLKDNPDLIFLVLGASCIMINVLWAIIDSNKMVDPVYYPFDIIITFIAFASFWFKRFIQTSVQAKQLAVKLQHADKQKDDFLANTSHELRNPLHGMLSIAQSMLESGATSLDHKNKKNLELMITVGRRMSLLLNDLLDMSQLKENKIHLQRTRLQVQSVASGVMDMLRFMTEGKPIQLVMDIPDPFPAVVADEKRLIQVLFNLLHNAIKYTNEGSITISAEVRNNLAHIHITDTGIGMDEETQQKIFQAYEQGDSTITSIGGGIGLGLSICQQLVRLHGGTIKVRSTLGQGSVFTFTLPLSNQAEQQEDEAHSNLMTREEADFVMQNNAETTPVIINSSITGGKLKLLAVDDDPINLQILSNILFEDKYEIVSATNGQEALAKLDTDRWDLVISDVMMPNMSGYELTRKIRERFSISELPILLLTARSRPEDVYSGFVSGANDYITKPIDTMELKARVSALTDLKQSVSERLRLEAAYLQAQIQPHFLFNTLNSITALSNIDIHKMQDLIHAFSSYLRISFSFWSAKQLVPIAHELELVQSYLFIEKERFENRLHISWEVDDNIDIVLPPLSIQPLVENAVRHGVLSQTRGGTVKIRIVERGSEVTISIIDDGIGISEEKVQKLLDQPLQDKKGIGLHNTDKRLKQLYGQGLTISSKQHQGTTISFTIPKKLKS